MRRVIPLHGRTRVITADLYQVAQGVRSLDADLEVLSVLQVGLLADKGVQAFLLPRTCAAVAGTRKNVVPRRRVISRG